MSKYIKVSSLSMKNGVNYTGNLNNDLSSEVERMIDSWDRLLRHVLPEKPDVVVLPEACDRYHNYPLNRRLEYYDIRGDKVRDFFMEKAKENSCYIAYSAARKIKDGTYKNTTQIIDRTGNVTGMYNKNYPTISETEDGKILPGNDADVIQCDFGKVACGICFDLNFDPLWFKYKAQKPDIILFSSAYHGGLMQNYRAYQLRSFFVGSIMNLENTIISPVGEVLAKSTNYFGYVTHDVNMDFKVVHLDFNWGKIEKALYKYGGKIKMYDPGYLGSVLLTSETKEFTIDDIIDEYKIELLDDYFERCMVFRDKKIDN